jgi:hypothetical protein
LYRAAFAFFLTANLRQIYLKNINPDSFPRNDLEPPTITEYTPENPR